MSYIAVCSTPFPRFAHFALKKAHYDSWVGKLKLKNPDF